MKQVEKRSLFIYIADQIVPSSTACLLIGAIWWVTKKQEVLQNICLIALGFAVLLTLYSLLKTFVSYRVQWTFIENEALRIYRPGFTTGEYTVPLQKIQSVNIQQGIFARVLGLYRLSVYTGGDAHSIAYISKVEAEELRARLTGGAGQ